MSEEEEKVIRIQFHNNLKNLIDNKISPTATAILSAEQPMILLFEELIHQIHKRQNEIEELEKKKNDYIPKQKVRDLIKQLEKIQEEEPDAYLVILYLKKLLGDK